MISRYLSVAILGWATLVRLQAAQYTCERQVQGGYFGGTVLAINDAGGVLGVASERSPSGAYNRWFLTYPDGRDVGPSPLTGAADVNKKGEVVGSYNDTSGNRINYLRNAAGDSSLPIDPPSGSENELFILSGINDDGYTSGVLGQGQSAHVFVRTPTGDFTVHSIPYATAPVHINSARQLTVNVAAPNQPNRAFIMNEDGSQQEIEFPGLAGTRVLGMNDEGAVTGAATYNSTEGTFGFLRSASGEYRPLLCSIYSGTAAADVNNSGQVLLNASPQIGTIGLVLQPTGELTTETLQLSFETWQFASHTVGSSSGAGRIYVTNQGTEGRVLRTDLSYFNVKGSPDFITQSNCAYLKPGETCTLTFTFTPTAAGARQCTYYLVSDDGQPLRTIRLRGTGDGQSLQLSRTDWTFASHPVGEQSGPGRIYIYNNGTKPVVLSSIGFEGAAAGDFSLVNGCPGTLPAYKTCQVTIFVTPREKGLRAATLVIQDSSPEAPHEVSVKSFGR